MTPKREARKLRSEAYNVDGKMRLPIDVAEIAKELNVKVEVRELPSSVAGFIIKEANESFPVIYVNSGDGPQRRRFTIAHELGHYIQNRDSKEMAYVDNRDEMASTGTDPKERWCNAFAAELLMPESVVKKYWAQGWEFERIRELLNVSKAALANRLNSLDLIQHAG